MHEEVLASVMANARVVPQLAIWGWQIAIYLFLGGFTGGIMVFSGWALITGRDEQTPFAVNRAPLVGFIALSVGMTALFSDLERPLHVWRFYSILHVTSPMSWGAWILLLVFPAIIVLTLAGLPLGFPALTRWLLNLPVVGKPLVQPVFKLCFFLRRPAAALSIGLGIALCIYTGILLSSFNSRPFWHSALLGPLFLVSGLSTGAAMMILGAGTAHERHLFGRIDLGLILAELTLLGLLLIDMLNGNAMQQGAVAYLLGGDGAMLFWTGFVGFGLGLPLLLEAAMWRRSFMVVASFASVLVLVGGFLLRDIVVTAGQQTSWTQLHNQFNPDLISNLRNDGEDPSSRF
ncbi:MAG: polysulfide reductase NrfD [Acidocella sp.]|nr:polysulfide reductase NrfD [Acidocella sp.]